MRHGGKTEIQCCGAEEPKLNCLPEPKLRIAAVTFWLEAEIINPFRNILYEDKWLPSLKLKSCVQFMKTVSLNLLTVIFLFSLQQN